MSYLYKLAGEKLEMAEADLRGFLRSQELDDKIVRNKRIAETEVEPLQIRRLAYTHEVCEKIVEKELDEDIDHEAEGHYAVRAVKIGDTDHDTQEWERRIGRELENDENEVDLDHPENEFRVYLF
ncbi:MAG: hypothetical protein BRC30_01150, partial [Nanohaloarchaea archaeon SW_7_46_7]